MRRAVVRWGAFVILAIALTWVNHWFRSVNGTIIEAAPGVYMVIPPLKV